MKRCVLLQCAVLILFGVFSYTPSTTFANSSCGNIIAPEGWSSGFLTPGEMVTAPITDCSNPFGATTTVPLPYVLSIEGQTVQEGSGTIYIETPEFSGVSFTGTALAPVGVFAQFLHTDEGLKYIPLQPGEPEFSEYEQFAATHITDETTRTLYLQIVQSDNPDQYLIDADGNYILDTQGTPVADGYYAFLDAFDTERYTNWKPTMQPGTYTYVWIESTLSVTQRSWWEHIRDYIWPVAYASFSEPILYTQTVTITQREAQPVGASSILFLPGIMGSHLFEQSDVCFGFGEQRRWFSHTDCEQERLFLDDQGNSANDIYTKSGKEGIMADVTVLGLQLKSMYASFMNQMHALEGTTTADFVPFPYDWRLRLDQLLLTQKNQEGEVRYTPGISYRDGLLYTTIAEMAEHSKSGKVTIVAHSNGGLLAKAFLAKLSEEHDPLEGKIDNLILVGSPQVGTPDAVTGVLHGTEIFDGVIVHQEVARQILHNAPMGYHLLPNEYYIDGGGVSVDTPVIAFDEGTTTADFRARYGEAIDSATELTEFLGSGSGRTRPVVDDLYTPEVGNDALLTYADTIGDTLANWTLPETLQVYQLAGIGVWTPKTLRYYLGEKCSKQGLFGLRCDEYAPQLEYQVYFTREGDGTVVVPSALAMSESENVQRLRLNLDKFAKENEEVRVHRDMFEIPDVATLVSNIASHATDIETEYISQTTPDMSDEHMLVYHLHSPLDMYMTSSLGIISSTTNTILGAMYRKLGEVQYIAIPETVTEATLHLVGYKAGSFTLNVEEWNEDTVTPLREYTAIPSGTTTQITLAVGDADARLQIDFDGDGSVDGTVRSDIDYIEVSSTSTTTDVGGNLTHDYRNSSGTRVVVKEELHGAVLGVATMSEEARLIEMIKLLQQVIDLLLQLKQYEKK